VFFEGGIFVCLDITLNPQNMFDNLNFDILDDSEFKEDAVREEIIMPILKRLGYSSSTDNKIRRGITLTHPFVNIGSTTRKINIIPDYILETQNGFKWILDAKAPNENILKSSNVEQAYSYAINPEVRCDLYALCNGRKLTVFHISDIEPLINIDIENINADWVEIETILSPKYIEKPHLKFFHPDFGVHLLKMGGDITQPYYFIPAWVNGIAKINDNLYTLFSVVYFGQDYGASFDFSADEFLNFIESIPDEKQTFIGHRLANAPFNIYYDNVEDTFPIIIEAKRTDTLYENSNEKYIPLKVTKFDRF